jgi:hypothetical protein
MLWDASGSLRRYADDERTWEVGQTHITGEVSEHTGAPISLSACGKEIIGNSTGTSRHLVLVPD